MGKYINTDNIKWYGSERITRLEDILAMPAEDVAPAVHAHWDKKYSDRNVMVCSNCEKNIILVGDKDDFKYCFNCGAKMDEKENEEK